MKLLPKDLPLYLKRSPTNFYFVWGDEPLQYKEAIEDIRAHATLQGYTERERYENNASFKKELLLESLKTAGLFSDKRFIELRLGEGKIQAYMVELLEQIATMVIPTDIIFLLSALPLDKIFQKSPCFNRLQSKGCTVIARALAKKEALAWLEKKFMQAGLQIVPEAIQALWERTEGNLLAAAQVIETLSLSRGTAVISVNDLLQAVGIEARFTLYELVDTALSGSVVKTSQIFYSLKEEGVDPSLIIWAIAREIRTILLLMNPKASSNRPTVWKQRESLIKAFMARFSTAKLHQVLLKAKTIDHFLKGHEIGNAWDALFDLCLILTGAYHV